MDQLLNQPEIQSAIAPFVVALLCFLCLKNITSSAWVWSILAAFLVAAGLINGFTFTPLTGTRKIILLVLASCLVAGIFPAILKRVSLQNGVPIVFGLLAILWVFWKAIARMDITSLIFFLLGGVALILWLTWWFGQLSSNAAKLHGAGFSLSLGTGLSAVAGASALLGQLSLSLASASAAVLLGWVLFGKASTSSQPNRFISTLPSALAPALIGLAAVVFARVPWYTLIPLASIPLAVNMIPGKPDSRFLAAVAGTIPGLIIAVAVAYWIWQTGSSSSGY